ncbi:MAG: PAS domain S-box protein [Rhodothermales bacterium]
MAYPEWTDPLSEASVRAFGATDSLTLSIAEIGPDGTVRAINASGRRTWGWTEGSRLPNVLRIGLSELEPGELRVVPIAAGGPAVLGVRHEPVGGWLLVDSGTYEGADGSSFRSLIENMPVCVTLLRADGTVTYANAEAAAVTGYEAEEIEGRAFWTDAIHPEDRWKLTDGLRRAGEGEHVSMAVRFLTRHRGPRRAELHLFSPSSRTTPIVECVAFDVTERSEVEEALFQSEALYRIFLEQSPVGMLHLDAAGTVTFENHQFRQIIGENVEDAWIGRSVSDIDALDARSRVLVGSLISEGEPFHGETAVYRRRKGGVQHLLLHGSPIFHPEGGIVGGVVMVEDRTDERRRKEELALRSRYASAESELRKAALSDEGQQAFLDQAAAILGESTAADRVLILTNNAADDCCSHRAQWRRQGVDEPDPVVILHHEEPVLKHLIAERGSLHVDNAQPNVDLHPLLQLTGAYESIWTPFFDESRLGGFVVLERVDVTTDGARLTWRETERHLVEQLVRLFETLWSWMLAGSRFRHITATIEDCLFTYTFDEDGERRYLFLTSQIESLTGYTSDEIISRDGPPARWSERVVHDEDQRMVDRHDEVLRDGRESRVSYRIRHADGSVRWLQEQATPETDGMGDVIVSGILADVTEQKAAEEVLTDARRQAESANRLKSAFIATMSHEIRTPMGAVNGFAELLTRELAELEDRGVELPSQVIEFLEAIRDNSKRLLTLVNDLFDLSNLEVGSIELNRRDVPVHELVMRSTSKVAVPLSRKGVDFRVDLVDADPMVVVDAQRLEQVLDNLLSNAVKFTQEGSVSVHTELETGWVVVEVADTGVGIAKEHLSSLFEPFVQEDSRLNRKFEGSGLGLSLVKRLLDLMDGRIEVESEKGEGSTFRIKLPDAKQDATQPVRYEL